MKIKADIILCNILEEFCVLSLPIKQLKNSEDSLKDWLLQVFIERDVQKELEEFIQNLFVQEYDLI